MSWDRLNESDGLDRMGAAEVARLVAEQQASVAALVAAAADRIGQAAEAIEDRLSHGGRLAYAGWGRCGRTAASDAAGLPKRFGFERSKVVVITKEPSQPSALPDDEDAIARVNAELRPEDALIAVSASGDHPFALNASRAANHLGVLTTGLTTSPNSALASDCDFPIVVATGAEVVMGDLALRSATAIKIALDALVTAVMARHGRVWSNLPVERELGADAWRVVEAACGCSPIDARSAVSAAGGAKAAIVMLRLRVTPDDARRLLDDADGNLRRVLNGA
ncbi:MAG: N-acetylmuramic acid 6-phosphate etherase [Thermoanaerobaculia bacterium]|nr:N-acetylmuramic acid 6-phosphate etherase [Thermoanaerobaculia bacterium]